MCGKVPVFVCIGTLPLPVLASACARSFGIWHIASRWKSENIIMTPVGFEPTQLALVELESTPLDHSGKVS